MRSQHDFSDDHRQTQNANNEDALPCLVVAADESRRVVLSHAAKSAGWLPFVSDDVPSAVVNYERRLLQLVIVDLHMPPDRSGGFHDLLEWFARKRHPLIVICGHEGDPREEIWARQLRPWLYLTGNINASELAVHLKLARRQVSPAMLVGSPQ